MDKKFQQRKRNYNNSSNNHKIKWILEVKNSVWD